MTEVRPFKAIHYNSEKAGDLSQIVCPPYDVISDEEQEAFHKSSPNNFIRILLGQESPSDSKKDNKYTRAKETFDEWMEKGVLEQDDKPCIYYYKQEYRIMGQRYSRLGFIALMKLQDEKDSRIFPHENTHSRAKEDRLKLWSTLNADLSSIFVCFSDKNKKVEKIFEKNVSTTEPFIDLTDSDNIKHTVWKLDDQALISEITKTLDGQRLFIADGHHRHEVAMEYSRSRLGKDHSFVGQDDCNYLMTYFTNMDSKDLQIFPMHRIIKTLPKKLDFLGEYFRIDKIRTKTDLSILLAKAGQNEHAFGMYGADGIKLLRLKHKDLIDKHIKEGSKEFRSLDATILQNFVFARVGIKSDDIVYTKDFDLATNMVDNKEAAVSFIMNPVRIHQLKDVALNGERMPPKTTYFYPKVLSGLTIYKMD